MSSLALIHYDKVQHISKQTTLAHISVFYCNTTNVAWTFPHSVSYHEGTI